MPCRVFVKSQLFCTMTSSRKHRQMFWRWRGNLLLQAEYNKKSLRSSLPNIRLQKERCTDRLELNLGMGQEAPPCSSPNKDCIQTLPIASLMLSCASSLKDSVLCKGIQPKPRGFHTYKCRVWAYY